MHKLVQEINGGDCEKNRAQTLMMLITLTSNVSKIPYVCKASDQPPMETEEGESAMPVPEEEVVKYKRQRYGEWGKDQQGQMMPLSANAVIVFRDTVEAMNVAAQLSLEAKKAEDKRVEDFSRAVLKAKQDEDKRLEDFSRAVLKAKQDEDKRLEEFGRSVRKGKCDDMDTEIMLAIRASELVGLKATAQALAITAKKNEIAAANDILELQIIQLNKSSELEKLKKTESENKTAREKAEVEAEMAHSALLHEQKVAQAKELLLPTVATPLAPATAKTAEAENPDLSTTVLKEYIKIQSQFNFKNDAEKKAVLSSAGMITANKYRAKWGFSPEQRLEGEYGAVNFYPAAEGGMIIDSLRDAIRKVRGKGLQPALCFVRLAVSDL